MIRITSKQEIYRKVFVATSCIASGVGYSSSMYMYFDIAKNRIASCDGKAMAYAILEDSEIDMITIDTDSQMKIDNKFYQVDKRTTKEIWLTPIACDAKFVDVDMLLNSKNSVTKGKQIGIKDSSFDGLLGVLIAVSMIERNSQNMDRFFQVNKAYMDKITACGNIWDSLCYTTPNFPLLFKCGDSIGFLAMGMNASIDKSITR